MDPLVNTLMLSSVPKLVWVKDLANNKVEEYEGEYDRMNMMMWIQDLASLRMKKPAKKVQELSTSVLQNNCGPKEKKFCLVGFYSNASEKAQVKQLLLNVITKY